MARKDVLRGNNKAVAGVPKAGAAAKVAAETAAGAVVVAAGANKVAAGSKAASANPSGGIKTGFNTQHLLKFVLSGMFWATKSLFLPFSSFLRKLDKARNSPRTVLLLFTTVLLIE